MATTLTQPHPRLNMPGPRSHEYPVLAGRIVPIQSPTIQNLTSSPGDSMAIAAPTFVITRKESPHRPSVIPASSSSSDPGLSDHSKTSSPSDPVNPSSLSKSLRPSTPAPTSTGPGTAHQPKIVQTAFIHKLYNMLEDANIQHLISWSAAGESFLMSPSADFSKVLSQYFKHTNISSFVRQLNMYGFHKVSDVFHSSSPDTALWEFKHGSRNFKRGDLVSLREIKRRASRHSLVHRDFTNPKTLPTLPGPMDAFLLPHDGPDARMATIEHTIFDLSARLQRSEENARYMRARHQAVVECTDRILQFSSDLCRGVLGVASTDSQTCREISSLQNDIQREAEVFRSMGDQQDQVMSSSRRYTATVDHPPMSPRQVARDGPRRSTLAVPPDKRGGSHHAHHYYRPPLPSALSISTRRPYGSIGSGRTSPSQVSPPRVGPPPLPPVGLHPLSVIDCIGGMPRRHTSADIRAHTLQAIPSIFASGPPPGLPSGLSSSSGPWPSSPDWGSNAHEDQRIRDSLSQYSLQAASQPRAKSRPATPPPPSFVGDSIFGGGNSSHRNAPGPPLNPGSSAGPGHPSDSFGGWSFNAGGRAEGRPMELNDASIPLQRRGSMAHILNPTDTAERNGDDDSLRSEEIRKRKRMQ